MPNCTGPLLPTPVTPSQLNVTAKQHAVPAGTPASAATLIQPVQFGGTGFGATEKSSLSRVAWKPGHTPAIDHVAPAALLQKTSVWTWLDPTPGCTSSEVKWRLTCPAPPVPDHWMSTLPDQLVSCGHGDPGSGPPPGRSLCGSGGRLDSAASRNTSKNEPGAIDGTSNWPIGPKSGANAPKGCDCTLPLTGSVACAGSSFVQCRWKRTWSPRRVQSVAWSTGFGRGHLHA